MPGFDGLELGQFAGEDVPAKGDVSQGFEAFRGGQGGGGAVCRELCGGAGVFERVGVRHAVTSSLVRRRRAKARARKPHRMPGAAKR